MTGRGAEQVSAAELGRKPGVPDWAVIRRELAQGLALALWASPHLLHLKRWRLCEPPWPHTFVLGSNCDLELGIALETLQGQIDLI